MATWSGMSRGLSWVGYGLRMLKQLPSSPTSLTAWKLTAIITLAITVRDARGKPVFQVKLLLDCAWLR